MNAEQAIAHVVKAIEKAGSQKAFAERVGVTPSMLSEMLSGKRYLSSAVLAGAGLEKVVTYKRMKS